MLENIQANQNQENNNMRAYVQGRVENKRGGQSKMVSNIVKKHGPITTAEILKRLKSQNPDCIRWYVSRLVRDNVLKAVKSSKPQSKMLTKKQAESKAKATSKLNGGRKFKVVKVDNMQTNESGYDVTPATEVK